MNEAGFGAGAEARITMAERAYRELKHRILENHFPAGTIMLEQELAGLLAMSRTPVREAMVRLAREGMIDIRPRHGMRVLPVSADDMREIYEILTALEAEAAGQIARDGAPPRRIAELEDAVAQMETSLDADDLVAWARADDRFHRLILATCKNNRLKAIIEQFWDQSHRVRMLTLRLRPKPTGSNTDHRALVDAIARRDPDEAQRIHHEHRAKNGRMLVELLERHGLTQL
jgi:DNA-binding GntR family transcriptional regulator